MKAIKQYPGHYYVEEWERDDSLFCPECGAKDVWVEQGGGDYYVGNTHLCTSCGHGFYLPSPPFLASDALAGILRQIRAKKCDEPHGEVGG